MLRVASRPQEANENLPLKTSSAGMKASALLIDLVLLELAVLAKVCKWANWFFGEKAVLEVYNSMPGTPRPNQRFSFTPDNRKIEKGEALREAQ